MKNQQTPPLYSHFAIPKITGSCKDWEKFFHNGTTLKFKKNHLIEISEQNKHHIFYIEKGEIQIIFNTLEGQQRTVITFGTGGIFNIAPAVLLQDVSGEFLCTENCIIHSMPIELILNETAIQKYPSLAISLIKHLSNLVLIYHTILTDLQIGNFFNRFCRYLLSLSIQHDSLTFPLGMTQDKLATILGVHRATLARAIFKLKQLNVINKICFHKVEITDLNLLKELACD